MSFEESIQQWVAIDNQIKNYNIKIRELRENRNNVSDYIHSYVEQNNLGNAVIQISDGKLKFQNTKISSPLTFKFLYGCLMDKIGDEEKVKELIDYIKEKREFKYSPDIRRTYS